MASGASARLVSPAPLLRPATIGLKPLLAGLAGQAEIYRDSALRFTCDEKILETRPGGERTLEFEYVYAYDHQGRLQDHRLTRKTAKKVRKGKTLPQFVDPGPDRATRVRAAYL